MNLKEKLKNGESVLGTMITVFDHVDMLRIFKNTGFDFVIIDNELGYFDYKEGNTAGIDLKATATTSLF